MTSREIRQQFLDFFASKEHEIVDSSPVVPLNDPTLMFTNAGMNQFKDVFLGTGSRPYRRAANTQKCIRAGGKHNDLDDVGQDTYHHTFFEMLGNWSFGDYFKKEAIEWAWQLLTEVWGIEKDRLHTTYFEGDEAEGLQPDTEAAELWKSVTDIIPSNIHPGSKKDNFWEMGETGPCGPCSEIHIDLTPDKSGASLVNAGDPRVIELWNLVFIQFSRASDGKLSPLPAKHVDTGMGFERLVAVLQGMESGRVGGTSNYDTDVWTPIFEAIQKRTNAPAYKGSLPSDETEPQTSVCADAPDSAGVTESDGPRGLKPAAQNVASSVRTGPVTHGQVMVDVSYRVIADHIRCLTFAITDGAVPSNEGRGYVLRRILRRAVRYGRQYFDMHEPFLCDLVEPVVAHMADAFPELRSANGGKNVDYMTELIRDEEASFIKTLDRGIKLFARAHADAVGYPYASLVGDLTYRGPDAAAVWESEDETRAVQGAARSLCFVRAGSGEEVRVRVDQAQQQLREHGIVFPMSGEAAFKLHDTYGFPIDLTELMAEENGLTIDIGEYERLMQEARERARAKVQVQELVLADDLRRYGPTTFEGNDKLQLNAGPVCAIVRGRESVSVLNEGQEGALVLDSTPFYAEQGGQIGDRGLIKAMRESWSFEVRDTQKVGEVILHYGRCTRGPIPVRPPAPVGWGTPPSFPPNYEEAKAKSEAVAIVESARRQPTAKNHSSTHMLNWALREVLGDHVQQKGSLVDPEKTRFDFSHNKPLTFDELVGVEQHVNDMIREDRQVYDTEKVPLDEAREIETLRAVFGEKYSDPVRVVSVGAPINEEQAAKSGRNDWLLKSPKNPNWMKYPVEFCGGTHLKSTGEAERFILISEEGVAKGVRRVVGITGEPAMAAAAHGNALIALVSSRIEDPGDDLAEWLPLFQKSFSEAVIPVRIRRQIGEAIADLQKRAKKQEKQAASASSDAVQEQVASLLASAETVGDVKIVIGEVPAADPNALRSAIDWVRNKTGSSAVLLATVSDNKVTLIAGMSKAVVKRGVKAGDLIKEIAPLVGGRGGGRPDMAQGGGNDPTGVAKAVNRASIWVRDKLT